MYPKLLIVEDEPHLSYLLKKYAQHNHYACKIDDTGSQCLEIALKFKPDVILMDLNLHSVSGLLLIGKLKQHRELAHIPIIVLSAMKSDHFLQAAIQLGADGYFFKGDDMSQLFNEVDDYASAHQAYFTHGTV